MDWVILCLDNAWELRESLAFEFLVALRKAIVDAKNVPKVN